MKKVLSLFLAVGLSISLAACGNSSASSQKASEASASTSETGEQASESSTAAESVAAADPVTITLGVPASPPTLPILRMKESKALGENVELKLDIWSEPETLIAMTQDGAHDMFAFPLTIVSTLYNKGVGIRLMNVNILSPLILNLKPGLILKGKPFMYRFNPPRPMPCHSIFFPKQDLRWERM